MQLIPFTFTISHLLQQLQAGVTQGLRASSEGTQPDFLPHTQAQEQALQVQSPSLSQSSRPHEDSLDRDISELKQKETSLDEEIAQLEAEGCHQAELDKHITLLHQYNELKDTGQMLLGRLALLRGATTKDLYSEFGMDLDD